MENSRMIKTANGLDKLFKILRTLIAVMLVVMFAVLTALTIANWVDPGTVIGTDPELVDIGPLTLELAQAHRPDNGTVLRYAWAYAAMGAVAANAMHYALGVVRSILAPMKQGQPFCQSVCDDLKKLGVVSIVLGVIANIGAAAEALSMMRIYGLVDLVGGEVIRSVRVNVEFDLTFLAVFFVLMLVRYIFQYGVELQHLSDETL